VINTPTLPTPMVELARLQHAKQYELQKRNW